MSTVYIQCRERVKEMNKVLEHSNTVMFDCVDKLIELLGEGGGTGVAVVAGRFGACGWSDMAHQMATSSPDHFACVRISGSNEPDGQQIKEVMAGRIDESERAALEVYRTVPMVFIPLPSPSGGKTHRFLGGASELERLMNAA